MTRLLTRLFPILAAGAGRAGPVLAAALIAGLGAGLPARAEDSAALFIYHRFGEDAYPGTNIRLEQFEAQIRELREGGYAVLPLPEIVATIEAGGKLPPRAVGITIDDAYRSVYTEAWPRLRAAGFPFTLFVATEPVDAGYRDYMNWDEIRELAADGVTIGHHTASHVHMADLSEARNKAEIRAASARFRAELGAVPTLFAYPYGEYGRAVQEVVAKAGFRAAFGQQSGVVYAGADPFGLPRFPLNERYGGLDRFRLAANALPLPVTDFTPDDLRLGDENPPALGFTIVPPATDIRGLACYAGSRGPTRLERLGADRIEVRFDKPFPAGRARINCTMPGPDGRWRWLGIQFYVPPAP